MEKYDDYLLSIVVPVYNEENGIEPFLHPAVQIHF